MAIKIYKNIIIQKSLIVSMLLAVVISSLMSCGGRVLADKLPDAELKALNAYVNWVGDCSVETNPNTSITNGSVVAIGDSILDSAVLFGDLKNSLKESNYDENSITINAITGRSINGPGITTNGQKPISAYDWASSNIDKIASAGTILIVLGTNSDSYDTSIPKFMKLIRDNNPNGRIFWVNVGTRVQASTMNSSNQAIAKYNKTYNYTIIDWHQAVVDDPSLIPLSSDGGDGIHPGTDGAKKLTSLIMDSLGKYDKSSISSGSPQTSAQYEDYAKIMDEALGAGSVKTFLSNVQKHEDVYKQAAEKVGIPWQMLPVIHNNETVFGMSNPGNGQGVYQNIYHYYPPGPITDADFLAQTITAAQFLKGEPGGSQLTAAGGPADAIKSVFLHYNGTGGTVYAEQAHRLGFSNVADGSPYVMNYADDQRNPKKNPNWVQFHCDGDCVDTANTGFIGAWLQYVIAGGVGDTGASLNNCGTTKTPGSRAGPYGWDLAQMIFYSQCDPRWVNKPFGPTGTICSAGCGLTSLSMVLATLTNDKSITPASLLDKYPDAHDPAGGTRWSLMSEAAQDYNLNETDLNQNLDAVGPILKQGGLVIISVGPHNYFTQQGHFMVIRQISPDGKTFYIADPAGGVHNGGYTAEFLQTNGLLHLWGFTNK